MERYQRVRKIGEGAFGKAILVRHKQTNRQCVVKEINIVRMVAKEREESRKEVAVLAQLKHPNIVTYIESFEEAGTLYIVMDYCAGGDMYGKINSQQGRLFAEQQILNWFVQLCLAMKHIHDRKILHRDIKSQNIFLTTSGSVKLGDFGIAKVLNNTVELARTCIGTPYYLSPEIVENKPYNNKSDIWSLGCVLYELTTLKHAFEAGNMKNLVLKIIRGSYPPVSPQYSYDLRGLIAQLFKRAPRDRPSINSILKKNFIMEKVRGLMSAEQIADEFSHTVMHGAKLAKALPPAPRPSSAPKKSNTPRPGSAGRGRYNPANVYGVPVGRKSQNRSSGDAKKRGGAVGGSGNRPVPIPGQQEWEQKKKDMVEREQKRREENKKKYEEQVARRHQNLVEKQKMDRMNKAREEGWRQLVNSVEDKNENRAPSPRYGEPRPLPMPRQKVEPVQPNYLDKRGPREPGNYDNYHAYLDKMKLQRQEREREVEQRRPDYLPAARPLMNPPGAPPAVQAAQAINQANFDRQKGAQAAERAKIVEDYVQRRQAAAANKARGQAELYGNRPPSGLGRATPEPRAAAVRQPVNARNREEQEYLEKLRQIREQNMRDRRNNLQQRAGIKSPVDRDAEERKKKAEGLKQQAEDWAKKKKEQLEKERQQLMKQQQDKMKQLPGAPAPAPAAAAAARPSSAKANMKPAPAVPITGMLQLIGANDKAAAPPAAAGETTSTEEDSSKSVQQKKSEILKRLNEKPAARGKWGADNAVVAEQPAEKGEVQMRRPWGDGPVSPMADPESARSQWSEEKMRLSDLPLEQTGSAMEATSARDKVVCNPAELEENPKSARNQWGRPGSTVVKALDQLPICENTVNLETNSSQESVESSKPQPAAKPAIGYTITLSDTPSPTPTPTPAPTPAAKPVPAPKPPIRSGTIVLKTADTPSAAAATTTTATPPGGAAPSPESLGVVGGKGNVTLTVCQRPGSRTERHMTQSTPPQPASDAAEPLIGETELPGSNRFVESHDTPVKVDSDRQRLSTVLETARENSDFEKVNESTCASESMDNSKQDAKEQASSMSENEQKEKKILDEGDGEKTQISEKPVVKPKPAVKPKPVVAEKPVLLPKPMLLSKPDQPYQFSEQAPEVVCSGEDGQAVFDKAPATEPKDALTASKAENTGRDSSVQMGLTTGNFDMKNVQLLRTCSEPNLTRLFRATVEVVKTTLSRHHSLEHDVAGEFQDDDSTVKSVSPVGEELETPSASPLSPEETTAESTEDKGEGDNNVSESKDDEAADEGDDDDDDEGDDDDDEEDEDLISMRETMQSLLLDDDGDADEEEALSPKVKFSLSSDGECTLQNNSENNKDDSQTAAGGDDNSEGSDTSEKDESANQTVRQQLKAGSKSESALDQLPQNQKEGEEKGAAVGEEEGDQDEDDDERLLYNTADILTLTDSDEETVFGDDDEDLDLFSRLEQQREELEKELGFDRFIEIYKTVQALQEDEDENMEEGARIAINMLGADKQHLYPRIFQLVMADTAFTEDNA